MATKPTTALQPPIHLQSLTADWFRRVVTDYELEPHHGRLLTLAAEAWDRCVEARETIAKLGLTYTDRFGSPRARPECAIERDSRIAFVRLVRELDLDTESTPATLRPPPLRSNRRAA